MPNALTSNFEIAAQVSEDVVNRILESAYLQETIPHRINRSFSMTAANGDADIHLFMPFLNFDVVSTESNPIKITFPLTATLDLSSITGEFNLQGNLSVITSVVKVSQFDAEIGAHVDVVVVDFRNLSDEDYTLEIVDDIENRALLELIIKELIRTTLHDETQQIALSPGVNHGSGSVQYFDMKIVNDTTAADLDYMSLFMNFSNTHTTPSAITTFIRSGSDFSLAISKELVDSQMQEKITERFGTLPARLPEDNSIVLRSFNMQLRNGYIRVNGALTKEIDCWWDADIDFSGDVYLSVSPGGTLTASSDNIDVDLPWWADFIGAIIPIIGWIALAVIYDAVEDMAGDLLADEASGAFSGLSLFPATIPQVGGMVEAAPSFSTTNEAVEIREEGLIIHGSISIGGNIDISAYPLIGNKRTKELHYSSCYWVTQMFNHNKMPFGRIEDALGNGYNGCWYCLRSFDTG